MASSIVLRIEMASSARVSSSATFQKALGVTDRGRDPKTEPQGHLGPVKSWKDCMIWLTGDVVAFHTRQMHKIFSQVDATRDMIYLNSLQRFKEKAFMCIICIIASMLVPGQFLVEAAPLLVEDRAIGTLANANAVMVLWCVEQPARTYIRLTLVNHQTNFYLSKISEVVHVSTVVLATVIWRGVDQRICGTGGV